MGGKENTMFDYGGNFYSRSTGYVIDGTHFNSADAAAEYLVSTCFMDATEAWSFVTGLRQAFLRRVMAAQKEG